MHLKLEDIFSCKAVGSAKIQNDPFINRNSVQIDDRSQISVPGDRGFRKGKKNLPKDAGRALVTLELDGKLLVVLDTSSGDVAEMSLRNIPRVQIIQVSELNAYDILCNDWLVFDDASMARLTGVEMASAVDGGENSTGEES